MNATVASRLCASLTALLAIGTALGFLLTQEIPVGSVSGTVLMSESGKPLSDANLYLNSVHDDDSKQSANEDESRRTRRIATTDHDGHFSITRVPAGKYVLSASTDYHQSQDVSVVVREARVAPVTMRMTRSQADLDVGAHQPVWSLKEHPMLPIRGYVDPAKGDFDTLHVRVWRTRLSVLLLDKKASDDIDQLAQAYTEHTHGIPAEMLQPAGVSATDAPRLVSSKDVPIQKADAEGFFEQRIPVPAQGPGLYLIQVDHGKASAAAWTLSTDTALVVKRADAQLVAYTVDMITGKPVGGAEVRQYRNGSIAGRGITGKDGLAELTLPLPPKPPSDPDDPDDSPSTGADNIRQLTVAIRGVDEAVLNKTDWNESDRQDTYAVYAYTDRTIYRPGQSISYKAVVRQRPAAGAALPYAVPVSQNVTVEVRDPQGDRVVRETKTSNRWGSFSGGLDLSPEAPTGVYSLICTVHGEKHTTDIAVASYRKPEYAVTIAPKQSHYIRGDKVEMLISAKYYFGAPVAGASVEYQVYRDSDWAEIYGPDYDASEDGPDNGGEGGGYYGQSVKEGTVSLDANGQATVEVSTDRRKQNADQREKDGLSAAADVEAEIPDEQVLTCHATVTDDAKRVVEGDGTAHLSAGDFALTLNPEGYVAEPGKPTTVVVTARDHDGKPVNNVTVYLAANYRLWNEKTSETDTVNAGPTQHMTTGDGGSAVLKVTPAKAGDLQLIATAYDAKGRVLHSRADLYASGSDGGDMQTEYSDLSLLTDKKKYAPGDMARILINTARTGETVLLTVEGDRVYRTMTVPITRRSTLVRLPVDAAWGPNVSLDACYVQNKKFAQSETPLRVRLDDRTINVTVAAGRAKYRPGDTAKYRIRTTDARSGRPVPCEVSLSVVDESIYALRPDDPHALRDAFYPHRTNRVVTMYSFSVAYLGDTDKSEPKIEMRRKFLDTAFWQPHLETGADGTAQVSVSLPDNLTTWRATVQAVSMDTSVGRTTGTILVTKPFFLRLDTPRFMTQTDDGRLLTLIQNETGVTQTAHVRLTAPGLMAMGSAQTQTLRIESGKSGQVEWPVKAQVIGTIPLRAVAWTDGADPQTRKPYTDGIETSLPVRAWGREETTSVSGQLTTYAESLRAEPSGMSDSIRNLTLEPNAIPAETKLTIRLTPSIATAMVPALDYLVGYPYGCTEQTMSRIFPDMLVAQTERQTGHALLHGPNGAKRMAALPRMVRDGIVRLHRFQHTTGAWGWWETDDDDPFLTAYVLQGLSIARDLGYDVPAKMLEDGRKGGLDQLAKAAPNDRPFLMYALALNGETDLPMRLLRAVNEGRTKDAGMDMRKLSPDALAYVVLLAKRINVDYQPAFKELERREVAAGELLHWSNDKYRWRSSDRMATALAMRAYLAVDPNDNRIGNTIRYLMASRTDGMWADTRDTSSVLNALTEYLAAHPADAAPAVGIISVRVNDTDIQKIDLSAAGNGDEAELLVRVPPDRLHVGDNKLEIAREQGLNAGTNFYEGTLRQVVAATDGALPAVPSQGVTVSREYLRVTTKQTGLGAWRLGDDDVPGSRFHQDDPLHVRLTVVVPRDMDYVLIEDEYPSNCEVTERGTEESALADTEGGESYWYSNVDVRDDRIAFFATSLSKGTHTIEYNLRAQTPGVCHALPAQVQAMYAPEIRAESSDSRVEVVK